MNRQPSVIPVMAHLVLGYPTLTESLNTAEKYVAAGVQILELQIPFSHPTADGSVITLACQEATRQGVSVKQCIEAIKSLRAQFPTQEIIVMSYLNRLYTYGFQAFVTEMEFAGVQYLIVPDLPADVAQTFVPPPSSLKIVPVLAANTSDARLEKLQTGGFDFFYLMSDFKITGSGFSLHPSLKALIKKIKSWPVGTSQHPPRVGIGFGISTPEQAKLVAAEADIAIIGSTLIQAQNMGNLESYLGSLRQVFN